MTRLLGSRERGAHPELQLGLRLETPGVAYTGIAYTAPAQQVGQIFMFPYLYCKVMDLRTARPVER